MKCPYCNKRIIRLQDALNGYCSECDNTFDIIDGMAVSRYGEEND